MNSEDLLRTTLGEKAQIAQSTLTLDDVRRDADARRRHSGRRTTLSVAAAVLIAVGAPTAFLLRPTSDEPSPAPSPTPSISTSASPSPSQTPTQSASGLEEVPRGADPKIPYLLDHVIHEPDGSTSRLPAGADDVVRFTPYHGGWIVLDSVGGLTQYDSTGNVLRQGGQDSAIVVSADQLQTAFGFKGHIYVGISSGMGDGEVDHPTDGNAGLVGFLGDRVVYNSGGLVQASDDAGAVTVIPGLSSADATSPDGDLVAGRSADDSAIQVVSASSGRVLWTKPGWFSADFSPDGKHLSAYRTSTGGEFETVAILDARTGDVVASSDAPGIQALPAPPTAWDDDQHLLIPYRGGSSWALLRLSTGGRVVRATDVVTDTSLDTPPFVFEARP
jgi:hypothetical protein